MAHLNLRDHRIEAKIAYVGPEAHILSTFARLRNEPAFTLAGERRLDWRPASKRFRDCDVFVTLVVGDREDADAVVTVNERTPANLAEEIATLETTLGEVMAALEAGPPGAAASTDAAHPLLDALRGVLRDTVREHVDDLAARIHPAKEVAAISKQIGQVREDIRIAADSVDAVMLRIQRFDAFMKRLEKVEESTNALNQRLTELIEELKKPKKSWFT